MKQIELLEQEMKLMLENIERLKAYQKDKTNSNNYTSHVVGEFKHRAVALKQRLTLAAKINTHDLFR